MVDEIAEVTECHSYLNRALQVGERSASMPVTGSVKGFLLRFLFLRQCMSRH
jgi:hypothetical protein